MVEGPGSGRILYWNNDKDGGGLSGFSASEGFQNPLFASVGSEEDAASGFQNSGVSKRIKLMDSNLEGKKVQALAELKPLGLTLSKTPSFLNLLEMRLSQAMDSNCPTKTNTSSNHDMVHSNASDFVSQPMAEKLKASNFSASYLKIGEWQKESNFEGTLVAKCYFAKRKLVWEILEGELKNKIEIQWSEILAIRAVIQDNEPATLEIELNQPPAFFKESNPQPRKHTVWHVTGDFTGGNALKYRRHYLKFPPGTLDKHYDKLLQCDKRLFMLSQEPFPSLESPYFCPNDTQFSVHFNGMPEIAAHMQLPPPAATIPSLQHSYHQVLAYEPTAMASFNPSDSTSPLSDETASYHGVESPSTAYWGQEMNNMNNMLNILAANQIHVFPNAAVVTQVNPALFCQDPQIRDLAQRLMSDSHDEVSDESQILKKVQSIGACLGLPEEVMTANNSGLKHMEYAQKRITDDHLVSGTTGHYHGQSGLLIRPNLHCLPPQVSNDIPLLHQPRNNPLNQVVYVDPAIEDFETVNAVNQDHYWM